MNERYKLLRANRVWIVYDDVTKENLGEPFPTRQEAERFQVEMWRGDKPVSSLSEPLVFENVGDLTESILGIVDRMFEPERMVFAEAA